jgi:spore maturation protein B
MSVFIVPVFIIFVLIYAKIKKVNVFKTFTQGAGKAPPLIIAIFPTLVAIFVMLALMSVSKVDMLLSRALSPALQAVGIPRELSLLIILRPFSGSASLAVLQDIMATHGPDSYAARAAGVIVASSDTLLYITTLYLTGTKVRRLTWTLPIGFAVAILGSIIACLVTALF